MGCYSRQGVFFVLLSAILCGISICSAAQAQGFLMSPVTVPSSEGRRAAGGLDLAPANPLGLPGGVLRPASEDIPLSSGMFPGILPVVPNLELGFNYSFGPRLRTGRFYADYLIPVFARGDGLLFSEAHAEGLGFWKNGSGASSQVVDEGGVTTTTFSSQSAAPNRFDLSIGGGYRRIIGGNAILGANAFYDTTRLWKAWYPAWGWGLEILSKGPGESALDLQFNHYGNQFNRNALVNVFRNKGTSWDLEAGYSHPLYNQALDLRLKFRGYQFHNIENVYGWNAGAELTTRNGAFTVRYEHGYDRINGSYDTVGGFVNVGFQTESLFKAENPFSMPQPVFGSPRNTLRTLTQKVRRDWHQPVAAVLNRTSTLNTANSPSVRRLILTNIVVYYSSGVASTYTADVPNNTYTVTKDPPPGDSYNRAYYSFRMSDGSLQSVRITTNLNPGAWFHEMYWELNGGNVVGPQMMNAATATTIAMFGPLGIHHVCFNGPGSGYVRFDVPSDPSIVPLVVQIHTQ